MIYAGHISRSCFRVKKESHVYSQINNFVALITCRGGEKRGGRGERKSQCPGVISIRNYGNGCTRGPVRYTGDDRIISMEINIKSSWVYTYTVHRKHDRGT